MNSLTNSNGWYIKSLLTIIFLFMIFHSFALNSSLKNYEPEIKFDRISMEHGLSENVILCIAQDIRGFLWIGTQAGLNRYDGNSIRIFKNEMSDPRSLSNGYIAALCSDKKGNLWVGTAQGLDRYDRANENFVHYRHDPKKPNSLSSDNITCLYEDQNSNLWVGTDKGLNKIDAKSGNIIRYQHQINNPNSLSYNQITTLFQDKTGIIWIGTAEGGLNKFDLETGKFTSYQAEPNNSNSLSGNNITAIREDNQGFLWIGVYGKGLDKWNRKTGVFSHYQNNPKDPTSLNQNSVNCVFEDASGQLWIGTNAGLNVFQKDTGQFRHYQNEPNNPQSLSNNQATSIMQDNSGILWIGTGNGLNKFDKMKQRFAHYKIKYDNPLNQSTNYVSAICKDKSGTLWIGTLDDGLNRFDPKKNCFVNYKNNPTKPGSISDNTIYTIYEDRSGKLWIGTQNGGLNLYDPNTDSFTKFRANSVKGALSSDFIFPIYQDRKGTLWIGTWGGGLNKYNPITKQFTNYKCNPENPNSLCSDVMSSIVEDSEGNLWLGTFQGLNKFNPQTETFTRFVHNENDPNSLSNNTSVSLFIDKTGTLWVGTIAGLNKFDKYKNTFIQYGPKNGLNNDAIMSIMEDKHGMLWVSTFNGVSKFDPKKEIFKNYNIDDGLQNRRFRANANFQASDGQMLWGGLNGFNAFYPEQINDNLYIPPVVLTDFYLLNQSVKPTTNGILPKSITEADQITLPYTNSVFSIEFASLHYSAPEVIHYAYMLEGFDKEWRYTDAKKRFATYTNLDGGHYTFKVKATNSDNIWNVKPTEIKIIITPPFWETFWFYLLVLLIILAIITITLIYLLKLKHEINDRKQAEQTLKESELKFKEIYNSTSEAIFIDDAQTGKMIDANEIAAEMYGYNSVEDILNGNIGDISANIPPYTEEKAQELISKAIQGEPQTVEWLAKKKNGEIFWVEVSLKFSVIGGLNRVISVVRDITERKQSENFLKDIIDKNPISIQVVDANGFTLKVNPAHTRLFGSVPPPDYSIFSDQQAADQGLFNLLMQAKKGEIVHFPDFNFNTNKVNPEFPDKPIWVKMIIFPIFGNNNKPEQYVLMHEDITSQKMASELIFAEKERLAVTLRSIGDGVITTDIHGNVILLNKVAEALTGWNSLEAEGKPLTQVFNIINETTKISCENPAEKVLETGQIVELANHTLLISKDGAERIIADSAAPIKNANNEIIGVVLVFRDMTEKQKLLEASQNYQKLESLGILAGGIAHDFNNLLSGLYGNIDLAIHKTHDKEIEEYLSEAKNTINRTRDLTQQLLTFAKGGAPVQKVGKLFPFIQETAKFALSGSNVACDFDIQEDLWYCSFDQNQIGQVIDNLVINAIQAMPDGGTINISARNTTHKKSKLTKHKLSDMIKISVQDSGVGIPKEMLSNIFDPFFTTKSKGHGLGLTTCYSIINRHDGFIEVESIPGKGTTFHIYLPPSDEPVVTAPVSQSLFHNGSGKILIMDDEDLILTMFSQMIKKFGYSSITAKDGKSALDLFVKDLQENHEIVGFILDLTIPGGLGGKDIIKDIRVLDPRIPVFVASGYSVDPIISDPAKYGFTASLCKPFNFSDLSDLFNSHFKS